MTTAASSQLATASTVRGAGPRKGRRHGAGWLGFTPFAVYVVLFLGIPAVYAVLSGFFDAHGAFTFANLTAFGNPVILKDFLTSFWLSAAAALISAAIGAVICVALLAMRPDSTLRVVIDSASSVLAQFGGIMLAFAFIALIGAQGFLTVEIEKAFGLDINDILPGGPLLTQAAGLLIPYSYFSIPLMVLAFMPAVEGLRPQWGEAVATLGGSRWTYWSRVGMPVLAPAFWGGAVLLFANAFSSFATAYALIDQGGIVPLAIQSDLTSETVLGVTNVAGVLAFGMVVVMAVVMVAYSLLQRRARRWER